MRTIGATAALAFVAIASTSVMPAPARGQADQTALARCDAGAESAERRRVAEVEAVSAAGSFEAIAAYDRLVDALLRNGKGAKPETLTLARDSLRIKEARLAADAVEIAPSLRNLGLVLIAAGDSQPAVPLLFRALAIHERVAGAAAPAVAETLDDLAYGYLLTGRYEDARRALTRSLAIKDTGRARDDDSITRTLERLARVFHSQGKYAEARPLLERALAISNRDETFNTYGDQLWFEGRFADARQFYLRAAKAVEDSCGDSHPSLAIYLRNLAAALARIGDLEDAVKTGERALAIAEDTLGPEHPAVADVLNDLANRHLNLSDYRGARALYERAIRIINKPPRDEPQRVATYTHNLSLLDARLGDFVEARRKMDRAIGIWTRLLGPDHPTVANALSNLGEALADQNRNAEARLLYRRALAIRQRTLEPGHKGLVLTQMALAQACYRLGDMSCATQFSRQALASVEGRAIDDDLNFADVFAIGADLELASGDYDQARTHYGKALAIRERVLGGANPETGEARVGISKALAQSGDDDGALEQVIRAEAIRRDHVNTTLRFLPERQSLDFSTRGKGLGGGALDFALSLSAARGAGSRVFDALVRSRALVLDEMAQRRHVSADASRPDVAPLWTAVVSARQRYSNLVVRGPGDQRADQYTALVNDARQQKESAEQALAEKSAEFRRELTRGEVGLDAIRGALPAGSALMSFARYERTSVAAAARTTGGASRARKPVASYIAFVTRAGDPDTAAIPLGPASAIDAVVAAWRNETTGILRAGTAADAEKSYRAAGAALRQRVWDPLRTALKDATMVFVVPDGTLNLVSLAALPVGQSRYLLEQGPVIHYLSAERDLVSNQVAPMNTGLLAVGGAAFDDASSFARTPRQGPPKGGPHVQTPEAGPHVQTLRAACGSLQSLQFPPLEGTRREAREIASLWTDSPAQILESRDANERAFKKAAPGHRVLHLATHGFFLGSDCAPGAALRLRSGQAGTRSIGGLSTGAKAGPKLELGEGPLLMSGLALAGANRRAIAGPDDEDGILTAEEVTALNLEGVEWAVLSACDTGLGEVKAGEGVFGLRRAFQIAGVRTVIMSLWPVDDQAARLWMRTLYERRLKRQLSTAEAMREASLSVLRDRRARGQTTHPFYWAAFVATGAWQ